jgi:hypothetical protein
MAALLTRALSAPIAGALLVLTGVMGASQASRPDPYLPKPTGLSEADIATLKSDLAKLADTVGNLKTQYSTGPMRDGSLSGERQQELTQHLESCAGCQAKLEEVATGGTNLSRVVEHLHAGEWRSGFLFPDRRVGAAVHPERAGEFQRRRSPEVPARHLLPRA